MKRVTLFAGHYGSGKTNIAVNYALYLRSLGKDTVIGDLDIVNPYFRTLDSEKELGEAGIHIICSRFANSSLDLPSLPPELYSLTDDRTKTAVLDIGGDDRGAFVLGRLAPRLREENDYDMLMVVNKFRPLTRTAEDVLEIKGEIESAGGIAFTGIVNNSNLGAQTTAQDVIGSEDYIREVCEKCGLPLVMTTADIRLKEELEGKVANLFPLILQKKIIDR